MPISLCESAVDKAGTNPLVCVLLESKEVLIATKLYIFLRDYSGYEESALPGVY